MAFTQPAAGSGLVTSSLTSGILVARNNAETTAGLVYGSASGTASRSTPAGHGITYASDSDGRHILNTTAATQGEDWTGADWGSEFTFLCVVKPVAFGGDAQNLISHTTSPARTRIFLNTGTGPTAQALVYDAGSGGSGSQSTAGVTDAAINVVGHRWKSSTTTLTAWLNGAASAGTSHAWDTIGSSDTFTIQAWKSIGQASKSPIYIWVLWNRALSDGEMATAMATLADDCSDIFDVAAPAPVLSSPTGIPTGPTQATIGVTSDTAPTATAISYQILPAATAAPSAATIVGTPDGTISTGSAGALTKAVTGLTTNTAVKVHFAQGATSNVVSSASFTPNTLAIAGTALSAQTGVAGSAFVWAGVTPESLITNTGNGTPGTAWTATAGVGASGVTVNASTGILVAATLGTAGSYTITLQRTDASTVPGAQTVTKTVGLTISGSGAATAVTLSGPSSGTAGSASTNFTVGANGTITGTVVVTPSDSAGGGTFTPTSVSISSGSPTGTFTYTAASAGVKSISVTNGGGLSNPSAVSYTASAPSGATFTSEPLKRNNGTLAASSALDYVRWYNPTTGALVLSKTGLSTNSSGIFSTTDAALSGSTSYALDWKEATGQRRMPIKATA